MAHTGSRVARKSAHVQFVNDGVFEWNPWRHIFAPIEGTPEKNASFDRAFLFRLSRGPPDAAAGKGRRRGIEKHGVGIEPVAVPWGPIDAPAVPEDRGQS